MINMRIDKSPNVVTLKSAEPEKGVDMSPSLEGIPIFKEAIKQFTSTLSFPSVGESNILYIDQSVNKSYRWDSNDSYYYVVGSDYNDIEVINGGGADL